MSLLFYDPVCPKKYSIHTVNTEPCGGTERSVARIAHALGAPLVTHLCEDQGSWPGIKQVVCLRDPSALSHARTRAPGAKLYLWCHDIAVIEFCQSLERHGGPDTTLLVVSPFHRAQVLQALSFTGYSKGLAGIKVIYNPIDDELRPDPAFNVDRKKLVFFSSPHKGLQRTIEVFQMLRKKDPDFRLYIANPGYLPSAETDTFENVVNLGTLPHPEVIKQVRTALCTFHMNTIFPETFGLVYAESNAVGTPFLTHALGAVQDLVDHPYELIDCNDTAEVVMRVLEWSRGARPKVFGDPRFRMSKIVREWQAIINV